MKFKRCFYDSTINFRNISKQHLIISIIIGLASAVIIYSFSYILREVFRIMFFGIRINNFPNIISESNRNLYNIFFAALSLIFANSIAISFLLSKTQSAFSRRDYMRNRILNDQIFLNGNFAYWFAKIGLMFGIFSIGFMDFDFIPYLIIPAVLLLIVLYLESWKTLIRVLGKKRWKYQIIHLLVMCLLTFGLSRLDIINYREIDKNALKANPIIDIPHSTFYNDKAIRRHLIITFKLEIDKNDELIIFTQDKRKISLEEVRQEIAYERAARREEETPFLFIRIIADKELSLSHIKMLEVELYLANQLRIIYDVYSEDILSRRFENRGIQKRISPFILEYRHLFNIPLPPLPPKPFIDERIQYKDTLKIEIGSEILVNNSVVSKNMLVNKFKNHINKNTAFEYNLTSETKYQDYITVLSSHFAAAYELRKGEQTVFKKYESGNNIEFRTEQRKLRDKFPLIVIEKLN